MPLAFLVAGAGRHRHRARHHPLPLRPAAGDAARHLGLSLILQQAVRTIFGPTNREVGNAVLDVAAPSSVGRSPSPTTGSGSSSSRSSVFAALLAVLRCTPLGLQMRAVTQNRRMAASMGIRTPRVDALTFGLGSGIAGIAGVALSQIDNVSPNLGQGYIIDSFMVVVFGGVGNLWGTLVGAFTLGIANKFLEPYAGAVLGKIADPRASSSCSSRSARAACSRSRAGRWKHDHAAAPRRARRGAAGSSSASSPPSAIARAAAQPAAAAGLAVPRADLSGGAVRQVPLLRAARALARSGLGLLRHPLARPRRLLRARRLRHGHVPDAPDRHAAASTPIRSCPTSWCS